MVLIYLDNGLVIVYVRATEPETLGIWSEVCQTKTALTFEYSTFIMGTNFEVETVLQISRFKE